MLQTEVREFTRGELGLDSEGSPEAILAESSKLVNPRDVREPEIDEPSAQTGAADTLPPVRMATGAGIADGARGEDFAALGPGDRVSQWLDRSDTVTGDDISAAQEAPPVRVDEEKDMEQQILAFEAELSLRCPMCNKDRVEACTTPTGKTYYKCASRDCHFVSWGRPLHLPCPRCNNPFLLQISDKLGRMAYKCPRATCHFYRLVGESGAAQEPTGRPLRRVVRRRIVRRKG